MTSFWAAMKVEFYDSLWPTKAAAIGDGARGQVLKTSSFLVDRGRSRAVGQYRRRGSGRIP
jgi:hypothetical protein